MIGGFSQGWGFLTVFCSTTCRSNTFSLGHCAILAFLKGCKRNCVTFWFISTVFYNSTSFTSASNIYPETDDICLNSRNLQWDKSRHFCCYDSAYFWMCMNSQHTFIIYVYIPGFYFNQNTSYLIFTCSSGEVPIFCKYIQWIDIEDVHWQLE